MATLNGINCGGVSRTENKVKFSLYDTSFSEISVLNGQDLTLVDGDSTEVFSGYHFLSVELVGNSYLLIVSRNIPSGVSDSLRALEINLASTKSELKTDISQVASSIVNVESSVNKTNSVIPSIIMRADLTDEEAIAYKDFYPEYKVGVDYKKDWIITYDGDLYRIGQDHTSQEQWVPGETGTEALYSKIEITEEGYEVWQEWDGVSGSYANGQIVKDPTDEQLYQSLIDNNVWGPPSTQPDYWQLYTES